MHVHGQGAAADLAKCIQPALALIGKNPMVPGSPGRALSGPLGTAQLAKIVGHDGEQNGQVFKITIGGNDMPIREMGATINAAWE
jgi:hypothetical protein